MNINKAKFEAVVKEAKIKTNNQRWLRAIERAADAILNDKWIITELQHCIAVTTESGKTYFSNGLCQCEAFFADTPCKHRAAARLIDLYNAAPASGTAREPRIVRSIEQTFEHRYVAVVRCDGWAI